MTIGATIRDEVTPWEGNYSPENLVTNLGNRGCSSLWNPLIGPETETTEYNSCLKSRKSLMSAFDHKYHIPFEFNEIIHNRGIFIVEGHSDQPWMKVDGTGDKTWYHA